MTTDDLQSFFYSLTPDKILAGAETAGVRCTGRILQYGSFENRVYEVEIDNDAPKTRADQYRVIKFYRPGRWSKEQIEEEHSFLRELQGDEIPVIAPVTLDTGSTLGTLPLSDTGIMYYTVFPKVQGRRPDDMSDSDLKVIGRLIARMHSVGKRHPARHRRTLESDSVGLEALDFLKTGGFIPPAFTDHYCNLVAQICTRARALFAEIATHRIHGDCHLGNVLHGQEGFFFLDFDDMVTGPAVQDFWLICGGRDDESKRQRDIFVRGYEEFAEFDDRSLKLIEPLRALRFVNYSAWIARRWADPIFPRTFPHFKAQDYWVNQLQDLEEVLEVM